MQPKSPETFDPQIATTTHQHQEIPSNKADNYLDHAMVLVAPIHGIILEFLPMIAQEREPPRTTCQTQMGTSGTDFSSSFSSNGEVSRRLRDPGELWFKNSSLSEGLKAKLKKGNCQAHEAEPSSAGHSGPVRTSVRDRIREEGSKLLVKIVLENQTKM